MQTKRGQAAMEFLMTYGWAILAAIVVIAVLAIYFKPSQLVSGGQTITPPLYGVASKINTTTVQLEVQNKGPEPMNITSFSVAVKNPTGVTCTDATLGDSLTQPSGSIILAVDCTAMTADSTFSADVSVKYLRQGSSLEQQSTGNIAGKVQVE